MKLSLLAIPADAINAFQDICRDIIVFRERPDRDATPAESAWQERDRQAAGGHQRGSE